MSLRSRFSLIAACLFLCLPTANASADGFPPFGAWAYGSSFPGTGTHVRSVYRSRPAWGGYTTTIRTRAIHHPYYRYYHRPVVSYRVSSPLYYSRVSYSSPTFFAPVYYSPIYYSVPTITYPVLPIVPSCPSPPTISVGYPLLSTMLPQVDQTTNTSMLAVTAADTSHSALRPVGTTAAEASSPPTAVLEAADAILQAGGFAQAARAYAEMSIRFGSSQELLERRFAAQVLNGDFVQAEIVLQLAELSEVELTGQSLSVDGIRGLLNSPILVDTATEALAEHALPKRDDPVALRTVATWLVLSGNPGKAEVFYTAALNSGEHASPSATPVKTTELVSFE